MVKCDMMRFIDQVIKNKLGWDVILISMCTLDKTLKDIFQLASKLFELNSTQSLGNCNNVFIIG